MCEVFAEGNVFCKKITYKIGNLQAEIAIKVFHTDPQYRIAVSVGKIATGTDIKPLECVLFMRDVKRRFVLLDCVGVTGTDKTELSKACKTGMLERYDLPTVFMGQGTIKAVA